MTNKKTNYKPQGKNLLVEIVHCYKRHNNVRRCIQQYKICKNVPSCLFRMIFINNWPPCLQTMILIPNPKYFVHEFVENIVFFYKFTECCICIFSVYIQKKLQFRCHIFCFHLIVYNWNIKYDTSRSILMNKFFFQLENI